MGKKLASQLVITDKDRFSILNDYPIDGISDSLYERIERLTSWFVLRAPLTNVTRLANPGSIGMFSSDATPDKGSRADTRKKLDETFLVPRGIDCTQFEFAYTRIEVAPKLANAGLIMNDSSVFSNLKERGAFFVGREGNKEDSCIESVCRHVRNALAHGRIAVLESKEGAYLFLEDGTNPKEVDYEGKKLDYRKLEVRARALLKVSTLEAWYAELQEERIEQSGICKRKKATKRIMLD